MRSCGQASIGSTQSKEKKSYRSQEADEGKLNPKMSEGFSIKSVTMGSFFTANRIQSVGQRVTHVSVGLLAFCLLIYLYTPTYLN